MLRMFVTLLLAACGIKDGVVEQGTCPAVEEVDALPAAAHTLLVSRTSASTAERWTQVITNASEWAAFLATLGPPPANAPEVDFARDRVLVARAGSGRTCGMLLDGYTLVQTDDGVLLDLRVSDPSATCRGTCRAEVEYVVAVTVPREGTAQACARRVDSCDPPTR